MRIQSFRVTISTTLVYYLKTDIRPKLSCPLLTLNKIEVPIMKFNSLQFKKNNTHYEVKSITHDWNNYF